MTIRRPFLSMKFQGIGSGGFLVPGQCDMCDMAPRPATFGGEDA